MLWKLKNRLTQSQVTVIYKSFVRSRLDHGAVIFDKAYNDYSQQKLESFQSLESLGKNMCY